MNGHKRTERTQTDEAFFFRLCLFNPLVSLQSRDNIPAWDPSDLLLAAARQELWQFRQLPRVGGHDRGRLHHVAGHGVVVVVDL